jgi:two-component system response regulator CpxR
MIIMLVDDRTGETDRFDVPAELAVHVRALLRDTRRLDRPPFDSRSRAQGRPDAIVVGDICIEPRTRVVTIEGTPMKCTSVEYSILERLARAAGGVVSREELMVSACDREPSPLDRALDVHISRIRRKLQQSGAAIVTVRGTGYMLAARTGS